MKKLILILLPLLPACAAIDGTVVNQSTGKPAANTAVSVVRIDQGGMEPGPAVRTDAQGRFSIDKDSPGAPQLIQVTFDGVTYNHMVPPGASSTGLNIPVYSASKQPGEAKISQHMMLFEPSAGQVTVTEAYIFENAGKITYNDPSGGTLRIYMPPGTKDDVRVNCTAPQGMPVERPAEKTGQANVYKVDFPIKPGETRIDVRYTVPLAEGGAYAGKILFKGQGPTRLAAPAGVTLAGENLKSLGVEPQSQANLYEVKGTDFRIKISGTGSMGQPQDAAAAPDAPDTQDSGPQIDQVLPKVFGNAGLIAGLAFGILALGFILLYRAGPRTALEGKHEQRGRR